MLGDVRERDHHTVDDIIRGAVGMDTHEKTRSAALEVKLSLDNAEVALHFARIGPKLIVGQLGHDLSDGPAAVHVADREQPLHRRRVVLDDQSAVEEHGCNLRAGHQVVRSLLRRITASFFVCGSPLIVCSSSFTDCAPPWRSQFFV